MAPRRRPSRPPFAGAVLCGGASRRMGRDKALIAVGGRSLVRRVADALMAAGATEVVAVGGDAAALEAQGLVAVPDAHPGEGPLGGILTALERAPADVVFVAACDLVDPSAVAVATTVEALGTASGADVAVPMVGGRRQWMHAAWRPRAAIPLGAAFAVGERAVHAAVSAGAVRVVDVRVDPRSVTDADTPAELPESGPAGGGVPVTSRHDARDSLGAMEVPEIDVAELARRRAEGVPVIDVREPDEYSEAHVPGATLVPLATVPDNLDKVPTDGTVYVVCAKGGRSRRAAEFYRARGIDAVNVAGGTSAWIDAGEPVSTGMEP